MRVSEKPSYVNLSRQQIVFAQEYVANGFDWETAYAKTGLGKNAKRESKRTVVRRWLKKPDMDRYIRELIDMAGERSSIDAASVLENFIKIRDAAYDCGDYNNANRANEHLGKALGVFVERSEQKVTTINTSGDADDIDKQIEQLQKLLGDESEKTIN